MYCAVVMALVMAVSIVVAAIVAIHWLVGAACSYLIGPGGSKLKLLWLRAQLLICAPLFLSRLPFSPLGRCGCPGGKREKREKRE